MAHGLDRSRLREAQGSVCKQQDLPAAQEIFGQLVSDHVPQDRVDEFTFLGPTAEEVRVFNWNIMGRALCRTSAGEAVTNNGLDLDESVEDYIRRLQEKVAPRLSAWIRTGSVRWVACLQEAPNHRHLRRDFLQEVQAGVPDTVQLQSADLAATAFTCTMTLWDAATWELQHCAHGGAEVLCTVLAEEREDPRRRSLRVLNCHFPLETDQTAAIAHVGELLSESPASSASGEVGPAQYDSIGAQQLVLVLGDLKLDLGHEGANQALMDGYRAGTASEEATLASGFVPGSAVYDWTRVTCDGAVLAPGKAASEPWAAVPTGSALKRWDPLQGLSCEDFISQYIHYALQDRVRHLPELSGEELGCLGAHHFGDQATELARLLEKNRAAAQAPEMESSCSATSRPAVSLQTAEAPAPKCSSLRAAIAASQQNEEELPVNRRFSPEGRQAFIQKHVHRKLQSSVADLDDEALWLLGQLHFSDQPTELPRFLMPRPTGSLRPTGPVGKQGYQEAEVPLRTDRARHVEGRRPATDWSSAPKAAPSPVLWEEVRRPTSTPVEGLAEWLQTLNLEEYQEAAEAWCRDMGAIWLTEVQENAEASLQVLSASCRAVVDEG
ncbi:unnamed protein product [Durusdinium trenchii]|uniref:Uncharacterized protein n=1 Tax=Durusdinium trenchii TaxID=1381693 RepID=A0ABP0I740_9DINO